MTESPPDKRRTLAPVILGVVALCVIGGLGAAVIYTRASSAPPLPPPPAPTLEKLPQIIAKGPGAIAMRDNHAPITVNNGATKECRDGLQPYGERCVSQSMADYISCVESSGGNKQEMTEAVTSEGKKKTNAEAAGSVKGAIAEGSGKLALALDDEASLVSKFESKWFSGAMSECTKFLQGPLQQAALNAHKKKHAAR